MDAIEKQQKLTDALWELIYDGGTLFEILNQKKEKGKGKTF